MGPIRLLLRADLRRRWLSLLALVVLAAVVAGVLAAGAAGARRTATVLDRFQRETGTSALRVDGLSPELAEDPAAGVAVAGALAQVPDVERVGVSAGFPLDLGAEDYFMVFASADGTGQTVMDRPSLDEGRMPDPGNPDEIVINHVAAEQLGLAVGDTVVGPTLTPEGAAAAFTGEFQGFVGPELRLEVVGIATLGRDLSGRASSSGTEAFATQAFVEAYGDEVGSYLTSFGIEADEVTPELSRQLTQTAREQVGEYEIRVISTDEAWADAARAAYRTLALAVGLFALVVAVAGLLVVLQAVSRQVQASGEDDLVARGLGMTRPERLAITVVPTVGAVLVGTLVGLVGAVAVSGRFPIGAARAAEVDPGAQTAPWALLLAAAVVLLVVGGWALRAGWRATEPVVRAFRPRRSRVVAQLGRLGARPSTTVGVRMAYERGANRAGLPVRSAVLGAAVAVAAVVCLAVVVRSADAVADDPSRYGWVWSTVPDNLAEDPEAAAVQAGALDLVESVARFDFSTVEIDGVSIPAASLEALSGSMAFRQIDGRQPVSGAEVALSEPVAEDLDADIGDTVTIALSDGGARALEVVGTVVPAPADDTPRGAVFTLGGLTEVAQSQPATYVAIKYDPDDAAVVEPQLEEIGYFFTPSARPTPPTEVVQVRAVRNLFIGLVVLLAGLGGAGLLHFLAISIRRRRGDLAVLRVLGFRRRDVRRSVAWQALAATVAGLLVGVPAGFVAGRAVWTLTVSPLGIIDTPAMPWGVAAAVVLACVAGAEVLALLPAWLAARDRPVDVLRAE